MKRGFVRVLWGDFLSEDLPNLHDLEQQYGFKFNKENKILIRRFKIEDDIKKCMQKEFVEPFTVYTFGEKNHKLLTDMGIKSILIHKEPYKYMPIRGIYKHKIDAWRHIMDDFDEVVFLDWDTYLTKPLPVDFLDRMNKKEIFQAVLGRYKTARIHYRTDLKANHLIPMGAFVYIRDKSLPEKLVKYNVGSNAWSCEPAYAQLTDELSGGWQGIQKYWELFEPEFYATKASPYKFLKEFKKPDVCFGNGFKDD